MPKFKMPVKLSPMRKWLNPNISKKRIRKLLKEQMQEYSTMYLFSYGDMRETVLTEMSNLKEWEDSKIWTGKNKIFRSTFAYYVRGQPKLIDLKKLYKMSGGRTGLLLTNRPHAEVVEWFESFSVWGYPIPGYTVDITIKLDKGPLTIFQPVIEPYLRQLGMPTTVENGVVTLTEEFEVCKEGTKLSEEQVHFLELLGEKLSVFKLKLKAKWTKQSGLENLLNELSSKEIVESDPCWHLDIVI